MSGSLGGPADNRLFFAEVLLQDSFQVLNENFQQSDVYQNNKNYFEFKKTVFKTRFGIKHVSFTQSKVFLKYEIGKKLLGFYVIQDQQEAERHSSMVEESARSSDRKVVEQVVQNLAKHGLLVGEIDLGSETVFKQEASFGSMMRYLQLMNDIS